MNYISQSALTNIHARRHVDAHKSFHARAKRTVCNLGSRLVKRPTESVSATRSYFVAWREACPEFTMPVSESGAGARDRYERLVRRFYEEAYTDGEYEVLEEMFASEYGGIGNADADVDSRGPEVARIGVDRLRTAFPDISFDVRGLYIDGDTAVAHLAVTGTHDGPWVIGPDDDPFVAEPTETAVEFGGMRSFRFEDGQVVESYGYGEWLTVAVELGIAGEFDDYVWARRD